MQHLAFAECFERCAFTGQVQGQCASRTMCFQDNVLSGQCALNTHGCPYESSESLVAEQ